jgi:cytochrome d ubiquinol oxidase subunit I
LLRGKQIGKWLQYGLVAMSFSGWVATIAGWYVSEIGRQPWLVTGLLTTSQAASKVPSEMIAATLITYVTVYVALIIAFISTVFYLARHAQEQLSNNNILTSDAVAI